MAIEPYNPETTDLVLGTDDESLIRPFDFAHGVVDHPITRAIADAAGLRGPRDIVSSVTGALALAEGYLDDLSSYTLQDFENGTPRMNPTFEGVRLIEDDPNAFTSEVKIEEVFDDDPPSLPVSGSGDGGGRQGPPSPLASEDAQRPPQGGGTVSVSGVPTVGRSNISGAPVVPGPNVSNKEKLTFIDNARRVLLDTVYSLTVDALNGKLSHDHALRLVAWLSGCVKHSTNEEDLRRCVSNLRIAIKAFPAYEEYLAEYWSKLMKMTHGNGCSFASECDIASCDRQPLYHISLNPVDDRYGPSVGEHPGSTLSEGLRRRSVPGTWAISRKDRNKLMHAYNGNNVPDMMQQQQTESKDDDPSNDEVKTEVSQDKSSLGPLIVPPTDAFDQTMSAFSFSDTQAITSFIQNRSNPIRVDLGNNSYRAKHIAGQTVAPVQGYNGASVAVKIPAFMVEPATMGSLNLVGPSVTMTGLFSSAQSALVTGTGNVSSELRQNLTQAVGDLALLFATNHGRAVEKSIGTSSADICLRLLLAIMQECPFSMGEIGPQDTLTYAWSSNVPRVSGVSNYFCHSGTPLVNPIVPTDIKGYFITMSDAVKISSGISGLTIPAGWEYSEWGNSVAVVPIRVQDFEESEVNFEWTLAHMEYPSRSYGTDAARLNKDGTPVGAASAVFPHAGHVRVPGPVQKVLYVSVDNQKGVDNGYGLRVGIGTVGVLYSSLNDFSGIAVNLGTVFDASLPNLSLQSKWAAYQRWVSRFGSTTDHSTALAVLADVVAVYKPLLVKHGNVVGGHIAAGASAPNPSSTQLQNRVYITDISADDVASVYTTALGVVSREWVEVGASSPDHWTDSTHRIVRHEPIIYLGMAANLYKPAEPMVKTFSTPCSLALYAHDLSKRFAIMTDSIVNATGLGGYWLYSPRTANARALIDGVKRKQRSLISSRLGAGGFDWLFRANKGNVAAIETFYNSVSGDWRMPYARVTHAECVSYGVDVESSADDNFLGFEGMPFVATDTVNGLYDILSYSSSDVVGYNSALRDKIRKNAVCGSWSTLESNTDGWQLSTLNGDSVARLCWATASPYAGKLLAVSDASLVSYADQLDEVELVSPAALVSRNVDKDFKQVNLALVNERALFFGRSGKYYNMVYQNKPSLLTGQSYVDNTTTSVVDVLSIFDF